MRIVWDVLNFAICYAIIIYFFFALNMLPVCNGEVCLNM